MTQNNRNFIGSISVRIGTKRTKLELSPAEEHDGEKGMFRVRIGRRWHDTPDGKGLFLDRTGIAQLIADTALGEIKALPETAPDVPRHSRISVRFWHDDNFTQEGTYSNTPPFRGYDGQFYIGVFTYAAGFIFVPIHDVYLPGKGWLL